MKTKKIYITKHDMTRLRDLLADARRYGDRDRPYLAKLSEELDRAEVVEPKDIPRNIITMNSEIRLKDVDTGEKIVYTLVFPKDANFEENRISILAPIGTAILGYKVGSVVEWQVPAGLRKLEVEEILYQPEAAGDYNL